MLACAGGVSAQSASTGQSGLIHMPDGRVGADGEMRLGASMMAPYTAVWGSINILPRLQFSGRYTRVADIPVFTIEEGFTGEFGNFRDKAFDIKLNLVEETDLWPSISIGIQDFHGTRVFPGEYIAASKAFDMAGYGLFDVTLGFGRDRFDGAFGGVRWTTPWDPRFRVVLEYDGYDYENDFYAMSTGRTRRTGGASAGLEFVSGIWASQVAVQDGRFGVNLSMMLPLQQPTLVPKSAEPAPIDLSDAHRSTLQEWSESPTALAPLFRALSREGFLDVRLLENEGHIQLTVSHGRMTMIGRAAGRVARIVAAYAPDGAHSLDLTLAEHRYPLVTYHFRDLEALRGFYEGTVPAEAVQGTLSVSYVDADAWDTLRAQGHDWDDAVGQTATGTLQVRRSALAFLAPITIWRDSPSAGVVRFQPARVAFLFNDPTGVLRYELFSTLNYTRWLSDSVYVSATGLAILAENISGVTAPSNSLLPHVRTDINRYRNETGRLSMPSVFVGHFANPMDRIYTSLAVGYLEQMFAGAGGEVMYLPETGNWAVDVAAYAVRQRDFKGWFGFQDYDTVTGHVSFHYRVPQHGLTFTTRAGRFLAGDVGARFEAKRRFRSGFEVGGWYTRTDGKDITSPGTPESPYNDKGVFVRFALGPFLPYDSSSAANFALSPWNRDVGQMLSSPVGGLYSMYERRLMLNMREYGPWTDFGY